MRKTGKKGKMTKTAAALAALVLSARAAFGQAVVAVPDLTAMIAQWSISDKAQQMSKYLTAVDQLYSQYDEVMNTIEMIKQNYEQYQHWVAEAKSWSMDDVRWDGDWDFRNEIRSVTSSVNKQLTNIRKAEECLTKKKFSTGGVSYSMADLFDLGNGGALGIATQAASNNFKKLGETFDGKLSEAERRWIWRKYGLSGANFYYVEKKLALMDEMKRKAIAAADDEVVQAQLECETSKKNDVLNTIMDGEQTEKGLLQKTALLLGNLHDSLMGLDVKMGQALAYRTMKDATDEQNLQMQEERSAAVFSERQYPDDLFGKGEE